MQSGYFSIVLHAHLPFVRHRIAGKLEERWFFEAISESYIPLIWMLEELDQDKKLTISFSGSVMELLSDSLMQRRYLQDLTKLHVLLEKEAKRPGNAKEELELIDFYKERLEKIEHTYLKYEQNLLNAFRRFHEEGKITCICSSTTHAILPFLQTEEGIRAQIVHGIKAFTKHFGVRPRGFWLPECAFSPGIDRILFEEGIRYTFIDELGVKNAAAPTTLQNPNRPCYSPYGLMLFPRNTKLSNQVWSSTYGYPGDFHYREFYRDLAFEREWEYIQPFMHPEGIRYDTGLKYHRITGKTEEKQFYIRENALKKAKEHSHHFLKQIQKELKEHPSHLPAIITTPFDAELFGHWWFEGPDWLTSLLSFNEPNFAFFTPEQYLENYAQHLETVNVSFHSWGRNGYGEVWLNEKNSWIYPKLHEMEKDLVHLVTTYKGNGKNIDRCLRQMVREWFLGVSSDWSFIINEQSATQYAVARIEEHIKRFANLKKILLSNQLTEELLTNLERDYPFLEDIYLQFFVSPRFQKEKEVAQIKRILMLAWEYPPMVVGGLSRHVYDLSKSLVNNNCEVHVITTAVSGSPSYEVHYGVHIHRVQSLQPQASEFYHWVGSLNLAFREYVLELTNQISFDIIHAHDWLVSVAAKSLKQELAIPIIATIHATEHGRNGGIYTELQKKISHKEWELTFEASKVIVCSEYMKEEVVQIFQLPAEKIVMIRNGVDIEAVTGTKSNWKQKYGTNKDIFIFSVGRIVQEKGFQTIIDGAPLVLKEIPNVKFIIAGKGPLLSYFQKQVKEKGLETCIYFIGFIEDQLRNEIFHDCDICLFPSYYEPFGIVALEGMIAGKPTIVSETGGLAEIITHEETGLTIYPKNAQSLATQVIKCIKNKDLSKKIAENGKRLAITEYSWNSIAIQTKAVYEASVNTDRMQKKRDK